MKKIKYNILGLAILVLLGLVGCKYTQDVEPVISPDGYPVATFTSSNSSTTVYEGDTIYIVITVDKMLDRDITFSPTVLEGSTADDLDFVVAEATLGAYTTEVSTMLIIADLDGPGGEPAPPGIPEQDETLNLEIGATALGEKYLLNPSTQNLVLNLTIKNVNDPSGLTIALGWINPDDDIDMLQMYDDVDNLFPDNQNGEGLVAWNAAASSANPEVFMIYSDDPPGRYLTGIDPYYVSGDMVDYTFSIGYPDQAVEFYDGVFDMNALESYPTVDFDVWGIPMYHLMDNVLNADGTFSTTHLNE